MSEPRTVSLTEVKELLESEQEERELSSDQKLALQHAQTFATRKKKELEKMVKELEGLEVVSTSNAIKIADIMPTHEDDVRTIFSKERFTLEQKDVEQILKIVEKYL